MKFTIIVPVYNVEDYIERCLTSIINQTNQDFEIILINDGSTDKSKNYCEYFKKKYPPKVNLINQKNKGLSKARNIGLANARGEYILFIDGDDYIKNTMLDDIYIYLSNKPDMIGFQHKTTIEDLKKHHLNITKHLNMIKYLNTSGQDFLNMCCNENNLFMMVWKYAYKKEFLDNINLKFHEGIIHEDEEWTIKALCKAKTFMFIDEELYFYENNREGSITSEKNIQSHKSYIEVAKELDMFIDKEHIEDNLRKKLRHRIFDMYYYNSLEIIADPIVRENVKLLDNMTNIKEFFKSLNLISLLNFLKKY